MSDEESKNQWHFRIPIVVVFLTLGCLGYRMFGDWQVSKALNRDATPAAWARLATTNWPQLVFMQQARFRSHSDLTGGCASLVRLPSGEIAALTAGHLLGKDCGVRPGFLRGGLGGLDQDKLATLDGEIVSWRLLTDPDAQDGVKVTGLFGEASDFDRDCDQVLLRVAVPGNTNQSSTALAIRSRPVAMDEALWIVGFEATGEGDLRQVVRAARRFPGGLGFTCELLVPAEMDGWSGAPILDRDGALVGIVTGGTLMDLINSPGTSKKHAFTGHVITELTPVIKAGIKRKRAGGDSI
jgi:CBS domain-containing protein